MPLNNIINTVKDKLETFLSDNDISNYEIVIGEKEIINDGKLYFGIVPENISYSRINTSVVMPSYTINILLGYCDTYINFITNYSELLENMAIYFFQSLAIHDITLTDISYDDINQVCLATIRMVVMLK